MQYSIIPLDTHAAQAFPCLEQGPDKLLDDYLHCVSDLLSKIYHTSDMSRISAKGTNHYAVVYGLNSRKLKDSMQEIEACSGRQWRNALEIYITSVQDMCEPRATVELNSVYQMWQVSMKSKW